MKTAIAVPIAVDSAREFHSQRKINRNPITEDRHYFKYNSISHNILKTEQISVLLGSDVSE